MSLEVRILCSIIKQSTGIVDAPQISKDSRAPLSLVRESLRKLRDKKLVQLDGWRVSASYGQKLGLAFSAIKGGVDIETVCTLLGWREFEDFVALVLNYNGFITQKHFRFKAEGRRFEIDVLGSKESLVLSIDCKRWKRSWQKSATMKIVEKQLERTMALTNSFQKIREWLTAGRQKSIKILPLILTLSETPLKAYENVPVVPIYYFQNFINNEMYIYLDEFMSYEVSAR